MGGTGKAAPQAIPGYQGSTQAPAPLAVAPLAVRAPTAALAAAGKSAEELEAQRLKDEAAAQNAATISKITGTINPFVTPTFARGGQVPGYADGGTTGLLGTKVDPASATAAQSTFQAQQAPLDEISGYGNAVAGGAQGVQAAQIAAGRTAAGQKALAAQLAQQVLGKGPNPALEQLKQTTGQNIQQATGMIASQKGINPALATRVAALAGANANQTAAGQAATQAAQQQLAAQNLQAQALSTQRGQDIAQQNSALGLMGTAGQLQQGQNAQRIQNLAQQQALNQGTASQNAALANQAGLTNAQLATNAATTNAGTNTQILGGVLSGLGAAAATFAKGGKVDFRKGGNVPGKAKVKGDSEENDTVPAMVSPGEIVVPRTVAQSPNAPEEAARFVAALKARKRESMPSGGYGRVLAKQREIEKRLAQLEKMSEGGEVEDDTDDPNKKDPGVVESIKRWFRGGKNEREVDDSVNAALPEFLSARESVKRQRAKMGMLDEIDRLGRE
jgi:hypothetical protein